MNEKELEKAILQERIASVLTDFKEGKIAKEARHRIKAEENLSKAQHRMNSFSNYRLALYDGCNLTFKEHIHLMWQRFWYFRTEYDSIENKKIREKCLEEDELFVCTIVHIFVCLTTYIVFLTYIPELKSMDSDTIKFRLMSDTISTIGGLCVYPFCSTIYLSLMGLFKPQWILPPFVICICWLFYMMSKFDISLYRAILEVTDMFMFSASTYIICVVEVIMFFVLAAKK